MELAQALESDTAIKASPDPLLKLQVENIWSNCEGGDRKGSTPVTAILHTDNYRSQITHHNTIVYISQSHLDHPAQGGLKKIH